MASRLTKTFASPAWTVAQAATRKIIGHRVDVALVREESNLILSVRPMPPEVQYP
ncbi:hypothetical protein [Comamonas serinivorans]|uniref:hypothetical protein n=1 Tax=Comamonas serinivorans TaxID=1082851 RepID=UPI0012F85DEF|nr:hypothetical protein [Comamonas serinivorans]